MNRLFSPILFIYNKIPKRAATLFEYYAHREAQSAAAISFLLLVELSNFLFHDFNSFGVIHDQ
jgi:hypothetical protein